MLVNNFLRSIKRIMSAIASLTVAVSSAHHAIAIEVNPGDLLVVDFILDNLLHVNPITGFRTVISGKAQGDGAEIGDILGVAVSKTGDIYLGDQTKQSIYRVNPLNGDRTVISSPTLGSGPHIGAPVDLAIDAQGQLIVANQTGDVDSVLSIDPITGNRTLLSGSDRGSGPSFKVAGRLRLNGDQIFLTTGNPESSLFQIDSLTGNRKIISGGGIGSGPKFSLPSALHLKNDGSLLVGDWGTDAIYSIEPQSGNRTYVAGSPPGSSVPLAEPTAFAMSDSDVFYICDRSRGILTLDLASGQFTDFSIRDSALYGEAFREFWAMTIVPKPVPEPAAAAMLLCGIVGFQRHRQKCASRQQLTHWCHTGRRQP
jgi:hypothetical protein